MQRQITFKLLATDISIQVKWFKIYFTRWLHCRQYNDSSPMSLCCNLNSETAWTSATKVRSSDPSWMFRISSSAWWNRARPKEVLRA